MNRLAIWTLGLAAFAALCAACVVVHTARIESGVREGVREALAARGLDGVGVGTAGRDVTLRAETRGQAEAAAALAGAVPGVRRVRAVLRGRGAGADAAPDSASGARGGDAPADPPREGSASGGPAETPPRATPEAPSRAAGQMPAADLVTTEPALAGDPDAAALAAALRQSLSSTPVRFRAGSEDLAEGSADALARAAGALRAHPEIYVEVGAHTDAEGSERSNRELSQDRADAARRALVRAGVDPDAITALGYGETRPVASNRSEAGREQNRRLVFTLLRRR